MLAHIIRAVASVLYPSRGRMKNQRGFWNLVAGAGLGGISGYLASKRKIPKYTPLPSWYQQLDKRSGDKDANAGLDDFSTSRQYMLDRIAGKDLLTDADLAHFLSPQVARTASDAAAARQRAGERALNLGMAPRSGMLNQALSGIDRSALQANRSAYGEMAGQRAAMRVNLSESNIQRLINMLLDDQSFRSDQYGKQYQSKVARSQQPGTLESVLNGIISGASAAGGMGGFGGGGGGGMGANPAASLGFAPLMGTSAPVDRFGFAGALGDTSMYQRPNRFGFANAFGD